MGWGSHHWDIADAAGSRWFVTADDLKEKRLWEDGPAAAQSGRLRAALTAARDLRDCGRAFVVAPVPARDGAPLTLVSGRFAVAVYPFVGGQAFTWGEFAGNTMLTAGGWVLIDWDTTLVAPRERDLWHLDRGNPADFEAYASATGVGPTPSLLELYRLRWDIADIASYASEFRRPHAGTANDNKSWRLLNSLIERVSGPGRPAPAGRLSPR